LDQTTRIHAPLLPFDNWHEISRPQIHGYDLFDVVSLGNCRFASIAEEKVVRVFEAPKSFVKIMKQLGVFEGENEACYYSLIYKHSEGISVRSLRHSKITPSGIIKQSNPRWYILLVLVLLLLNIL